MLKRATLLMGLSFAISGLLAVHAFAKVPSIEEQMAYWGLSGEKLPTAGITPYDSGPDRIDTTGYQIRMNWYYDKVFRVKCAKCHTLARPINAPFMTRSEWEDVIDRMAIKPGANITREDKRILSWFLSYDARKRKKDIPFYEQFPTQP